MQQHDERRFLPRIGVIVVKVMQLGAVACSPVRSVRHLSGSAWGRLLIREWSSGHAARSIIGARFYEAQQRTHAVRHAPAWMISAPGTIDLLCSFGLRTFAECRTIERRTAALHIP